MVQSTLGGLSVFLLDQTGSGLPNLRVLTTTDRPAQSATTKCRLHRGSNARCRLSKESA
jgi:hypothetical protein